MKQRVVLAATVAIGGVAIGVGVAASQGGPAVRTTVAASAPPSSLPSSLVLPPRWTATLDYVIDGDTQRVIVDLGGVTGYNDRALWSHLDVVGHRLLVDVDVRDEGINAAEHDTAAGKAAISWSKAWFLVNPGPYTLTTTETDAGAFDKYGRFLGVITAKDGRTYNVDAVHAGYASPYAGTGTKPVPGYPPTLAPNVSPAYG
jgi:endonuclease YncB( thermonuclease family)